MSRLAERLSVQRIGRGNVVARALWGVVRLLLFRPTPRPCHRWRALLLRLFGARVGRRVRVYPSVRVWAPWNLVMGDDSCLGDDVDCYSVARVTLGDGAVVSQYTYLCTASHDYRDPDHPLVTAPIEIGARAWVTADVFVGPGVRIGEGTVVTARSSVFADLPSWSVARGNPARRVGARVLRDAPSA